MANSDVSVDGHELEDRAVADRAVVAGESEADVS